MENLAIFCADVGSIKNKKFGWAASLPGQSNISGTSIEDFAELISKEIRAARKVAVGFECPLFVPVRSNALRVNSARMGEGNRPWSAGAGTGALATGLVEVLWVMNEVSRHLGRVQKAVFNWSEFLVTPNSVFLWEAFVSAIAKGAGHGEDAEIAVSCFEGALPEPWSANAIQEDSVLSLVGAAALRANWSDNVNIISKPCLVIKA